MWWRELRWISCPSHYAFRLYLNSSLHPLQASPHHSWHHSRRSVEQRTVHRGQPPHASGQRGDELRHGFAPPGETTSALVDLSQCTISLCICHLILFLLEGMEKKKGIQPESEGTWRYFFCCSYLVYSAALCKLVGQMYIKDLFHFPKSTWVLRSSRRMAWIILVSHEIYSWICCNTKNLPTQILAHGHTGIPALSAIQWWFL